MDTQTTLVIFALVAALGLVTVVAVDIILSMQEAEAGGCQTSQAFNASQGRCLQGAGTGGCSGVTPAFNASQGRCFRG